MARSVNCVWNYCNDVQRHALKWGKRWPTRFDLNNLTAGCGKELGLLSSSVNAVCQRYAQSRSGSKRPYLRFRGRKSLGWVPFRGCDLKVTGTGFRLGGVEYAVWLSRPIPQKAKLRDGGSFSQDARGRWYLNVVLELPDARHESDRDPVGIDLGLKQLATLSTGESIAAPQVYRRSQAKLGKAQRAGKKRLARRLHAKVSNQRRDYLHKVTAKVACQHGAIYVGNVSSSKLVKTSMAKSVLDAGWSSLRKMLAYKSIANGGSYREVNEAYSTQTCSDCGVVGGPKGRKGLVIREWTCECGAVHDRDVNAARNILRLGLQTP